MDILHRCIVNDDNRPKSPFGCASVRVRTSRACLASRALYVKTRGEREREKAEGHANSCAAPFAERLLKRARLSRLRENVFSSWLVTWIRFLPKRRSPLFQIRIALLPFVSMNYAMSGVETGRESFRDEPF